MKLKFTIFIFAFVLSAYDGVSQSSFTYTGKPRFQIETRRGGVFLANIKVELFPNIALKHVRNFDSLVSVGFYDTTAFHRCIPGFMIQGGDPNSRSGPINTWGYGQPNQPTVPAEFSVAKHLKGILSAARSNNPNSATSQFFICQAAAPSLNGQYSIYGRVTSGLNYIDTIALCPKMTVTYTNTPLQKVEMFITYIGSNDTIPVPPPHSLPADASVDLDYAFPISVKWNAVSDGIIYEAQVSDDPTFSVVTETLATSNLNWGINNLLPNTKYYWRVRTNNGGHFSSYSNSWSFKTIRDPSDPTGVKNNQAENLQLPVFPNPSKGKFNFTNLKAGNVIEIFDVTGKLIYKTTVKDPAVTIDLEGKEKGTYLYKIINSQNTSTGKLIID